MDSGGQRDKQWWRTELLARRAAVTPEARTAEAAALARSVRALLGASTSAEWIGGYIPVGTEPGSLAMLDALRAAGARVLVPVTGPPGPLDWAEYTGAEALRRARYGLLEPDGPRLGPKALGWPRVVLIPALAVDRRGVRLGRGAGYYDRSLPAARPDARLVAVVRDEELVDRLPEQPHDRRMSWALLPFGGLCELDADEPRADR
ncbi:5-formyltetrahydrofolate cyclo-ligase [Nocardia spumae]|uniref:5-formyltetrahydrofolate cyclo-ligase n=1 Tax=Nocardia spumae TaxID=2887190 RepID=UPI001D155013|nr:5-formyltetrahydrofolate cyclo-ligase [Nocardia spumae]